MSSVKIVGNHAKPTRNTSLSLNLGSPMPKQVITHLSLKNEYSLKNKVKCITQFQQNHKHNLTLAINLTLNTTYITDNNQKVFIRVVAWARDKVCQVKLKQVKCQKLVPNNNHYSIPFLLKQILPHTWIFQ